MIETVVALLMVVSGEIKEHRIQSSMSECLKGKRHASRSISENVEFTSNLNFTGRFIKKHYI